MRQNHISGRVQRKLIRLRPRQPFTRSGAEADAQSIIEIYRRTGRYSAQVEPVIIERDENRIDLVFEIYEGEITGVNAIDFVGNEVFSDRKLRSKIDASESGIFSSFFSSDVLMVLLWEGRIMILNHTPAEGESPWLFPGSKTMPLRPAVRAGTFYDAAADRCAAPHPRSPPILDVPTPSSAFPTHSRLPRYCGDDMLPESSSSVRRISDTRCPTPPIGKPISS